MSEYLQNKEYKQRILKGLINDLHKGRDFDEVKKEFGNLVEGVDATEIADMEQQLINEGMPPEEIKMLCDVHAAVFREALLKNEQHELVPGHPLHDLKHENDEARKVLSEMEQIIESLSKAEEGDKAATLLKVLQEKVNLFREDIGRHYSKKENIFFPYLEKHNITGPTSVMWSVDDEIRDIIKQFSNHIGGLQGKNNKDASGIKDSFVKVKDKVIEMFFKEENILTPMMKDALTEAEWSEIKEQSSEFGVIFSRPELDLWQPQQIPQKPTGAEGQTNTMELDTGSLTPKQVNTILTSLPIDITFVDKNDVVRYFSQGKERIFTRTKSIIGRKVQNCHPPESVHVVEKIVNDFKTGKHNTAEFWLELNGSFIYIKYLALRDENAEYLGTMEVSQDLTRLRALQGERRLLQYSDVLH